MLWGFGILAPRSYNDIIEERASWFREQFYSQLNFS